MREVIVIPAHLYEMPAMLASPSKNIAPTVTAALDELMGQSNVIMPASRKVDWFYELKLDGVRCMAYLDAGEVTLINRNHVDISYRYPDLVEAFSASFPTETLVLDGEIVVLTNGKVDFAGAHRRDAQVDPAKVAAAAKALPATFMAFDLIFLADDDLRRLPYTTRRALLAKQFSSPRRDTLRMVESDRDGRTMWQFVLDNKLEGLIAKRSSSPYSGGRSPSWLKLKVTHSVTAMVSGFDPGKGARSGTVGNLHLVLLDAAGKLTPVGKVGSGFTDADLAIVLGLLTNPTGPLLVEVEYAEVSAAGQLRFPVFKGIRKDVELLACTTDQLR